MTDLTNFAETEIRDWLSMGVDPAAAPAELYVALHNNTPGEDATGEVSAASYARVQTSAGLDWGSTAENDFYNLSEINFGSAGEDWGSISGASLWDNVSAGNPLVAGVLSAAVTINQNDTARFPSSSFSFTID